jgi:predicted dienelactone hydrolase
MKWIRRGLMLIAALMAALVVFAIANALRTTNPVGFRIVEVPDPGSVSIAVGVWYPTQARPRPTTLLGLNLMSVAPGGAVAGDRLPLIVISHGNGGDPGSHAPVQLWSGPQDVNVPEASNAAVISRALGKRADVHSVPGAEHFSFLVPCRLMRPPLFCRDAEGFDRAAFHAAMNAQVVAFFRKNL